MNIDVSMIDWENIEETDIEVAVFEDGEYKTKIVRGKRIEIKTIDCLCDQKTKDILFKK